MVSKEFWQVDAFASETFKGNPCAVFLDAEGLDKAQMQAIAAEMNLSETVFLFPPKHKDADYLARIFTPREELPFAGHPTISAAFVATQGAVVSPADKSEIIQECGIGLVPVEIGEEDGTPFFTMTQGAPEYRDAGLSSEVLSEMLGCGMEDLAEHPVETVSTGIWWLVVALRSPEAVASLKPNLTLIEDVCNSRDAVGVAPFSIGAHLPGCEVKVRAFPPSQGIVEDPVTGSANGCIGAYIARHGLLGGSKVSYVAEQGRELGREGRAKVTSHPGRKGAMKIRVGGSVVKVIEGRLLL